MEAAGPDGAEISLKATVVPGETSSPAATESLRTRLLRGSTWMFVAFGMGNVVRLVSSLLLTRLLAPDLYGVMQVPYLVASGLQMFSDIGSGPAIIRDARGDDPVFLNTAWTLQVIRGFVLCLIGCTLAWPISHLGKTPEHLWILPIVMLQAVLQGFNSTKLFTAQRYLRLGPVVKIDLAGHILQVLAMYAVARVSPTVWALIPGVLVLPAWRMVMSHIALPGEPNRFCWDRSAIDRLFHFGKWIFLSSALYFMAREGDRMMMAGLVDEATLGIFGGVALMLVESGFQLIAQLSHSVMYPAFSEVNRDSPERLSDVFYRVRGKLNLVFMPILGAAIGGGGVAVYILYDARYHMAGWMVQMLCVRAAMRTALDPCEQCIVAIGRTRAVFWSHVVRAAWMFIGLPIGWRVGGLPGLMTIAVLCELGVGAVFWTVLGKANILRVVAEGRAALLLTAGFVVGLGVDHIWTVYGWR